MVSRGAARLGVVVGAVLATSVGWASWQTSGQTINALPGSASPPQPGPARFEFLVVESFDSRYLGDTPGHLGRAASGRVAPRIALGDPVLRGTTLIGEVTHLIWNEARESLEVEFNPKPGVRICIGDPVSIPIPPESPR